ncbi:MAG: antitoxin component YwqK of YwqJK toxin-antitoxin module, partial [Parvicellaceae bacterium]
KEGQIISEGGYANNNQNGLWKYYFQDGILKEICNWNDGEAEGVTEYYFPNGLLKATGSFMHNKKEGAWQYYDSIGNKEQLSIFKNDNCIENCD